MMQLFIKIAVVLLGSGSLPPSRAANARGTPLDLRKGVLHGRVLDVTTGQSIAGATVALQDKKNETVVWTKTDAQGNYTLAGDTLSVLQLEPSRRKNLLAQIAGGRVGS